MKWWIPWVVGMVMASPVLASDYVNPALTCARVQTVTDATHLEQQMVLWQGVVLSQTPADERHVDLYLQVGAAGVVRARYLAKCPTLQVDRTGYRVGVKGRVHFEQGRFDHVEGVSLILLEPAGRDGFRRFLAKLPSGKTDLGTYVGWRFWFHHPDYAPQQAVRWGQDVVTAAGASHVDPLLLAALMQIESAYDVAAVSHSGAMGLGQLMSFTAAGMGLDAKVPEQNIQGSAKYLGGLLKRFSGWSDPIRYSLAAYNAGPVAVERAGDVPHVPETTNYVTFVKLVWKELHAETERLGITERLTVRATVAR